VVERLDHFLIIEKMLEIPWIFKLKVVVGGNSDHFPIVLEITNKDTENTSPMQFNHAWLLDLDYEKLVMTTWVPLVELE
jgi:hypothetical protein